MRRIALLEGGILHSNGTDSTAQASQVMTGGVSTTGTGRGRVTDPIVSMRSWAEPC